MKNLFIIILLLISMCLWAQNVPQTIDYQGRLADSNGNYLNGVVTVSFLIYDVETGGTALWNETQDVSTVNGIFHVLLGSAVSFPPGLFDGADRWLELVVSGETLSPRTCIASVPYSIKAETAYTLQNTGSGSGLDADLLDGQDSSDFMPATTDNWVNTTGDTMTGQLIVQNNVGIGTTTPDADLHVDGSIKIVDGSQGVNKVLTSDANGAATWQTLPAGGDITAVTAGTGLTGGGTSGDVTLNADLAGSGSATTVSRSDHNHDSDYVNEADLDHLDAADGSPGNVVYVNNAGNVGIGTNSPTAKLDVNGDVNISGVIDAVGSRANGTFSLVESTLPHTSAHNSILQIQNNSNDPASEANIQFAAGSPAHGRATISATHDVSAGLYNGNLNLEVRNGTTSYIKAITIRSSGNVGIGTTTPDADLHVDGSIKIVDGSQGANKVLTSDANGAATWQTLPAETGDISSVTAGIGLNGGGTSGAVTLNVDVPLTLTGSASGVISGITSGTGYGVIGSYSGGNYGYLGSSTYGVYGRNYANSGRGVYGYNSAANGIGVYGYNSALGGYGVYGYSTGYYGGYFTANYSSGNTHVVHALFTGTNYDAVAVYAKSRPVDYYGIGGYFEGGYRGVSGFVVPAGNFSYRGVYGQVSGGSGTNYAIYGYANGSGTNYAGYFAGNVTVTGTFSNPSDERFKENVQPFRNALSKIKLMNVHTFNFIQMAEGKQLVLPEGEQIGLIAQELEEILPELVVDNVHAYDKNEGIEGAEKDMEKIEYKGINYIGLIPVLIEAIKEQQQQIEELQQQIAELK
jgi:hypothetical protein